MSETDSLSLVGQEVHRYDPDRFLTVLMAPEERREDLFALYAFNTMIARIPELTQDDILARMRLQWWRDTIASIYESGTVPGAHPVAEGLAGAIRRHTPPLALFDQLLDAREMDVEAAPLADLDALETYVEGTGGALSRVAAWCLGATEEDAQDAADLVGRAYALVGLLRATPFFARQGRIYLPEALLLQHGVSSEDVLRGQPSAALADASRDIADGARRALQAARDRRAAVPKKAVAAYLPAIIAEGYLKRLRAIRHDLHHPRMGLPKRRPLALLFAAMRGRF